MRGGSAKRWKGWASTAALEQVDRMVDSLGRVLWLASLEKDPLPYPIRAGIGHYPFATIPPYHNGNQRK